jgi:hypothetical protein
MNELCYFLIYNTIVNSLVPFFPNTIEKKTLMMPKSCLIKCLKGIYVQEIIDDIIVIINYGCNFVIFMLQWLLSH